MHLNFPNILSLNSFVISSIIIIFIVSFPAFSFLRVYLIILHFFIFYFFILYKNKKIYFNKSLFIVFLIFIYILVQNLILEGDEISIIQALVMTSFLFITSQIALAEGVSYSKNEKYKLLSCILLIFLPLFLISFTEWNSLRKPGLFMNPNITSHLAVMLLPIVMLGLNSKTYKFLAFFLVFVISIVTASRSAMMALVLGMLSYVLVSRYPRLGAYSLLFILSFAVVFSIYSVDIAVWIFNKFSSLLGGTNSRLLYTGYNGRDVLMEYALNRFEKQPILGLGFDGTKFEVGGTVKGTHNGLMELLLKFGILGTVIFLIFILNLVWMTSKHNSNFKAVTMMSLTLILSLATNSSTFFVLNYLFIYTLLLVYLGFKFQLPNSKLIND